MRKSTIAALLSAFVFPGVGHIFLKKYIPGIALVGASLAATYYLISKTVEKTLQIVDKIQSGDVQLDVTALTGLVSKQSTGTEAQLQDIAMLAIIICWLVSIVDSYRVGCVQDKNEYVEVNRKT
jgi:hypothetical protein